MNAGHPAAGFSLAEVIVAVGLLGGVLISMAGLVVLGNRHVKAGRSSSEATALVSDVAEEMGGWGYRQTYSTFGCVPTAASCAPDSGNPRIAAWADQARATLGPGSFSVLIEPLGSGQLGSSKALRVSVSVGWSEGERQRSMRIVRVRS